MKRTHWLFTATLLLSLLTGLLAPVMAQDGARPFIGIRFEQREDGALLAEVMPGSPADEAGLQVNDLITAIDGQPITLENSLIALMEGYAPGDTITLAVDRRGETLELPLTLGIRPEDMPSGEEAPGAVPAEEGVLRRHISVAGVLFVDLGDRWQVAEVEPGSAAAEAGLFPGDMAVEIDGHPLAAYDSGVLASRAAEGGDLLLVILRGEETLEITLTLEAGTAVSSSVRPTLPVAPVPLPEAVPVEPIPMPEMEAKGYLGVAFVMLDPEIMDALAEDPELPFEMPVAGEGALIIGVQEQSPADQAGIVMGDVVVEIDGDRVDAERTLADRIYAYEEGDTVVVTMLRGADVIEIEVTLVARPPELGLPGMPLPVEPPRMAPGLMPFMDPEFDLDGFLEENPGFLDDLREFGLPELMGPLFMDPDFDWGAFLAEHPGLLALMERLAEDFAPEDLQELFPQFPWFGEHDPFHQDMDPRMPSDEDNNPA